MTDIANSVKWLPVFINETASHTGATNYTIQQSKEIQAVFGAMKANFHTPLKKPPIQQHAYILSMKKGCAIQKSQ